MYEFTKDCMINIKEIDDEHRRLFQMLNEAIEMNNSLPDITKVSDSLIANLKDYAATHFAHEEAYMESINDPELPLQKKEHAAFAAKVNDFKLDTSSQEASKASFNDFLNYLVRWLYKHILSSDMMIGKMQPITINKQEKAADSNENKGNVFFAFTDKYMTGVELIDDEHRRLFEIINDTVELIRSEFLHDKYDQIVHLLEQLKDYTEFHFKDEEEYMEKIHYPRIEEQKHAHAAFIEKLVEIDLDDLDNMDDNQQEYLLELVNFLATWLVQHILGADKLIGEFAHK